MVSVRTDRDRPRRTCAKKAAAAIKTAMQVGKRKNIKTGEKSKKQKKWSTSLEVIDHHVLGELMNK